MNHAIHKSSRIKFFLGIILPTLLAIVLSIVSIYLVIIPAFKDSFIDSKKEMIQELTTVAWNILIFYEEQERAGIITRQDAQSQAIKEIRHLRYGSENKDYFFITDLQPVMVMHPYSPELEGKDLSTYQDANGQHLFVAMKRIAETTHSGYLNYTWHTKYDDQLTVPKLSFVKQFLPWQWVVGTGVFLDDVERKTAAITSRLTYMVLATIVIFSLLLIFVAQQSFSIEKKRRLAEEKLSLSREKYKALAESTTHPVVMVFDKKLIYANKSMCSLLGYNQEELKNLSPWSLFPGSCDNKESGMHYFNEALSGSITEMAHEGLLLSRDGALINVEISFSSMKLGEQAALVMTAKDIRSPDQHVAQSDEAKARFEHFCSRLGIGVFRINAGNEFAFEETTETARQFFGFQSDEEVAKTQLLDLIVNANERNEVEKWLDSGQDVLEYPIHLLSSHTKSSNFYSLSLIGRANTLGQVQHYDGMIQDISQKKHAEQERENLIVELQTSLLFLNQPIKFSLKNFVSCSLNTSISEATRIMAKHNQSSILVLSESGETIGIITDMVLRERVIAENLPYETPVFKVMSSPLIYIDDTALIFEAVLLMQEKNIKHLVVKNSTGEAISVISNEELLNVHRYSTAFILGQINEAENFDQIVEIQPIIPRIVKSLADSGAHAKNITRVITRISDAILEKIIDLTIEEMGEPPARFAFVSVGSEGRGEQTLVTDQDNALIFEDISAEKSDSVRGYFEEFGKRVCTCLDKAGYTLCLGEIMAMNPKWCQPLSTWQEYFSQWIKKGTPQDLLEVNIFFDLRSLYGDPGYVDAIRRNIHSLVESRATFLKHLAQNSLGFKPPIDFFGNIHAESGEHTNSFDIKKVIACIVGFARVYAIENGIESTNTIQRIEQLHKSGEINSATFEEIIEAYDYLMKIRFKHQVNMIDEGKVPDNYIKIDEMSHMEKIMLKKAFSQVVSMQKRLSYDFSTTG